MEHLTAFGGESAASLLDPAGVAVVSGVDEGFGAGAGEGEGEGGGVVTTGAAVVTTGAAVTTGAGGAG